MRRPNKILKPRLKNDLLNPRKGVFILMARYLLRATSPIYFAAGFFAAAFLTAGFFAATAGFAAAAFAGAAFFAGAFFTAGFAAAAFAGAAFFAGAFFTAGFAAAAFAFSGAAFFAAGFAFTVFFVSVLTTVAALLVVPHFLAIIPPRCYFVQPQPVNFKLYMNKTFCQGRI